MRPEPRSRQQGPYGPVRAIGARPPQRRSTVGPLLFTLVVIVAVVGLATGLRPVLTDALVDFAAERDTLMRQPAIRALVAARVGAATDLAADPTGQPRIFEVRRGERAADVARRLEDEGLVRSRLAFLVVLYETEREGALQSGVYQVSPSMTPREIARLFERAPDEQVVLRLIEGWRLTEISAAVTKAFPKITAEQFAAAAVVGQRPDPLLRGLDPKTSLEGFLYPDTYFLRPDATPAQIVDTLLLTFDRKAGATLRLAASERKTTMYDLVKLASLVEREARDRSESATIAGVYANRLGIGMKLDADPTIQYALGQWRVLTLEDLKLDSLYNSYRVAGLPPTPICSPGLAALEAAADPDDHEFLFFVAKADGTGQHLFARTLDEHEANRVKVGNR